GEHLDGTPTSSLHYLGRHLQIPVLAMDALYGLEPDFSVLAYPDAVKRLCLLAQDAAGELLCVITDPFDLALQTWLESRVQVALNWRLSHPADLAAYLAVMADRLRAIDGALDAVNATGAVSDVADS
ncbi:MAG TPA: hypothetical protein PLW86_14315, partial [Rhodocyclaceae bacterium]|nr:hypothetical protein [Rhodocyclaceae bacterium]